MMIAVSLPMLLLFAVLVSAIVMWLNARGVGVVASAGVILVTCTVVAVLQRFTPGSIRFTPQGIRIWVVFVLLPAVSVLAISRLGLPKTKPWLLLLFGPTAFIVTLVIVMTVHNMLFASHRSP